MHGPTLEALPEDVLDRIFQLLEDRLRQEGDGQSRLETFSRLCLVNRSLLPFGRRWLYSDPLVIPSWWSAYTLLHTLEQHGNSLGGLVRSLLALPDWLNSMPLRRAGFFARLRRRVGRRMSPYSWVLRMLSACPNLREVGLVFNSSSEIDKLLDALAGISTIEKIRVRSMEVLDDAGVGMTTSIAEEFLHRATLPSLKELDVGPFASSSSASLSQNPHPIQALHVSLEEGNMGVAYPFLPTNLCVLRSLSLCNFGEDSPRDDLVKLVELVGKTLTSFCICSKTITKVSTAARHRELFGPALPLELFKLLPRVQHLTVSGFETVSVNRVAALSRSSPSLITLDFGHSSWTPDEGQTTFSGAADELVSVVAAFDHLQRVHLGVVPASINARWIESTFADRDVEVEWTALGRTRLKV